MIEAGWTRLRRFWRPSVRTEVEDELAFHFAMRVDQLVGEGVAPDEAERRARQMFGDVQQISARLSTIDARRRRRLDLADLFGSIGVDLRYAVRSLRKQWMVTLVAILTLSIGIGASTAVFSVIHAVLLRPLPYGDPDRLGVITADTPDGNLVDALITGTDVHAARLGATLLDGIAAFNTGRNVPYSVGGGAPEPLVYVSATTNIFNVLRLPIAYGRNFTEDDGRPNQVLATPPLDSAGPAVFRLPRIAIVSYELWQRRFRGDSSILGRSIVGPWGPTTIVGVASPRAELLLPTRMNVDRAPDVWEAIRRDFSTSRPNREFRVVARVRPSATVADVRAQIDSLSTALATPVRSERLRFEPLKPYLLEEVRPALVAVMGAVAFVLLIACANVANLMLVRAAQRDRELAVRAAIGGSPWRIIRQLLAESILLAALAAALGVLLARFGVAVLVRLAPANVPRLDEVSIDGTVLGFSILATLLATLVSGLLPALRVSRPRVADVLRAGARAPGYAGGLTLRNGVVIAEVALSLVLLVGCGLMVRSFSALVRTDLGFDPSHIVTFTISNRNFRLAQDRTAFNHEVHARLVTIPGVSAAMIANELPFAGDANKQHQIVQWHVPGGAVERRAAFGVVDPGYFALLRTPMVDGHTFSRVDTPRDAIVIDDRLARQAFGDAPPIGRQISAGPEGEVFTVIGVVKHQRRTSVTGDEPGTIYFAQEALNHAGGRWAIRVGDDTTGLATNIRTALASVKANYASNTRAAGPGSTRLIVNDIEPLSNFVDRAMAPTRFALVLITIFAVAAALLTAIGLYGVVTTMARQRTSEIGIRLAFGAETRDIFRLVVGHGLRLSSIGLVLGLGIALAATKALSGLLVAVQPRDPATFIVTGVVFLAIALAACWIPARRAAALDPSVALRDDH